jgi:hypothetical protein
VAGHHRLIDGLDGARWLDSEQVGQRGGEFQVDAYGRPLGEVRLGP